MTVGERMKERRKALGISAEHVAKKLCMSPATIYRYENGEIEKIPGNILELISKVLQTTPAFLMGWEIEPQEYGKLEGSEDDDLKEQLDVAREEYRKMLTYAIDGVKHRLWKTAFDLNRPELTGEQAQETAEKLRQMAHDLAGYEAEAARIGGV